MYVNAYNNRLTIQSTNDPTVEAGTPASEQASKRASKQTSNHQSVRRRISKTDLAQRNARSDYVYIYIYMSICTKLRAITGVSPRIPR